MPKFDSIARWERYEPAIGNNQALPPKERFYLEISTGLSTTAYVEFFERLVDSKNTDLPALLEGVVRMGKEPLWVEGKHIATLADYVDLAMRQPGLNLFAELIEALKWHNSVEGEKELFSERLSGGSASTVH